MYNFVTFDNSKRCWYSKFLNKCSTGIFKSKECLHIGDEIKLKFYFNSSNKEDIIISYIICNDIHRQAWSLHRNRKEKIDYFINEDGYYTIGFIVNPKKNMSCRLYISDLMFNNKYVTNCNTNEFKKL